MSRRIFIKSIHARTAATLNKDSLVPAVALRSIEQPTKFVHHFKPKGALTYPLFDSSFCPVIQRTIEIQRGEIHVKDSKSLERIHDALLQSQNNHSFFRPSKQRYFRQAYNAPSRMMKLEDVESFLKNKKRYKKYNGRAPITNGSYYFGTSRRGGVLGDIFIDLDSEEFKSSKKKLDELKTLGIPTSEIVSQFVEFFRDKILDYSPSVSSRLKQSQHISKTVGIMPLSAIIILGYGDCRPHALAITALLNYAGIKSEYANFNEVMQSKDQNGIWGSPYTFDHSIAIYTGDDGKQYIADSYFYEFNNLSLNTLLNGFESKDGIRKYQFTQENSFPIVYVKNSVVRYDNTDYALCNFGLNGGITLMPRTCALPSAHLDLQAIKDIGTVWDLKKLERGNAPLKIGMNPDEDAFITYRGIRILDMPIRLRGESYEYKIPTEITMFQGIIQKVIDHAHTVSPEGLIKEFNTYLTIDQTWVEKGTAQRKPGIHTDGFQGSNMFGGAIINYGYITSNLTPTAFYTDPFYFKNLDSRVHSYNFEMDRQGQSMSPQFTDEFDIYFINAYSPHAATVSEKSGYRTFFRLLYDKDKYDRYGNSINRLLDYKWKMVPNANLSRLFRHIPSLEEENSLITKICFFMERNHALNPSILNEVVNFYETLKIKNIQQCYNFIYRLFALDLVQLSCFIIASQFSAQVLSDYAALRLVLIPLGSKHDETRKQASDLFYQTFEQKIREGKMNEISGLIYEITNDRRYTVNKDKFNELLEPSAKMWQNFGRK